MAFTRPIGFGVVAVATVLVCLAVPGGATAAVNAAFELVSRASGVAGQPADASSRQPAISADGRSVAFTSGGNLDPGDAAAVDDDVYVRDLDSQTTTLVSRASGPDGDKGNSYSSFPSISGDGSLIAFSSVADNLTLERLRYHVYLRDLAAGTTTLVSRASGIGGEPANDESGSAAISANGQTVAFTSRATNLDPDINGGTQAYVRDLSDASTLWVSRRNGPHGGHFGSGGTRSVSGDGTRVPFSVHSEFTSPLRLRDLGSARTTRVADDASDPRISTNGRSVVYSYGGRILIYDVEKRKTKSVTTIPNGPRRARYGFARQPTVSSTGRFVGFVWDRKRKGGRTKRYLWLRDMRKGKPARVRGVKTTRTDDFEPSISGDGSSIAFQTRTALVPEDTNADIDVYVAHVENRP